MFTQFRVRYPQGSLITDLLAIDRGHYIVRCCIQVEGITLATGLAAAETIELAEDQARSRALAVLGITQTPAPSHPETPILPQEELVSPQATPSVPATFSSENLVQTGSTRFSPNPSTVPELASRRQKKSSSAATVLRPVEETTFTDEFSVPEVNSTREDVEPPSLEVEQVHETQIPSIPAPSDSPKEFDTDTGGGSGSETPIDFSDIIARTNVELKRLGWTNQQGRDYLVQTYGKRSRQLLTDEELLDFLSHLESEPTPE